MERGNMNIFDYFDRHSIDIGFLDDVLGPREVCREFYAQVWRAFYKANTFICKDPRAIMTFLRQVPQLQYKNVEGLAFSYSPEHANATLTTNAFRNLSMFTGLTSLTIKIDETEWRGKRLRNGQPKHPVAVKKPGISTLLQSCRVHGSIYLLSTHPDLAAMIYKEIRGPNIISRATKTKLRAKALVKSIKAMQKPVVVDEEDMSDEELA